MVNSSNFNGSRRVESSSFNLGYILDKLEMSQSELSERIGISKQSISAWSKGKYQVPKVVKEYLLLLQKIREIGK